MNVTDRVWHLLGSALFPRWLYTGPSRSACAASDPDCGDWRQAVSIAVQILPGINVIQIAVDGDSVFIRRDQCTEFLSAFMQAMADTIPEPDTFSRKVPSTPALRLVGAFGCDPDESCGQAERDPDRSDTEIYGAGS